MSTFDGYIREFPYLQVDFFRGGAAAAAGRPVPRVCLLSHAHSDHLAGLDTHRGPFVYCSAATRELVLRLTRRPGRLAFARGEAEARARPPYRHLRGLLKALPLDAPTRLETGSPGRSVQVTLLDANHCVGAVMFLIEGDGKAVLYTGDVRAEPWWVNSLVRHPALVEYTTAGLRALDRVYLDTSNVADVPLATKAEGIGELLRRVAACPSDAVFYLDAWTYGYEDVWMALAKMLRSRIHVDDHKLSLYSALAQTTAPTSPPTSEPSAWQPQTYHLAKEAPYLAGFTLGNTSQPGILTNSTPPSLEEEALRIHSCELGGAPCAALQKAIDDGRVVWLRPVVGRRPDGEAITEAGLEAVMEAEEGGDESIPERYVEKAIVSRRSTPRQPLRSPCMSTGEDNLTSPIYMEASSSSSHHRRKPPLPTPTLATASYPPLHPPSPSSSSSSTTITFPYARHSSLPELRHLVSTLRPRDVWPCTADVAAWTQQGLSVAALFGDLLLPRDGKDGDALLGGYDAIMEAWQQQQQLSPGDGTGASQAGYSQFSSVAVATSPLQEDEEEFGDEDEEENGFFSLEIPSGACDEGGSEEDHEGVEGAYIERRDFQETLEGPRATKRGYSTYAGHTVAGGDDEGETGRERNSQTPAPSTPSSDTRKRAFRAMETNSGGVADWVSIDLISTTANHSCLEPELGAS